MRRWTGTKLVSAALIFLAGMGCGAISVSSLSMKGAMWAAEQGAKKVIKDRHKIKRAISSRPAPARADRD